MLKNLIALDFETYINKKEKYSLRAKKMGMSDYIRDPRFLAHGAGIRTNRMRKAKWVRGENLAEEFEKYDWSKVTLLCHNTAFDAAILHWHYGHIPKYYLDTLSMARPLYDRSVSVELDKIAKLLGFEGKHDKEIIDLCDSLRILPRDLATRMGLYGSQDVDELWNIYLPLSKRIIQSEHDLIHLSIKAFVEPVIKVNLRKAKAELDAELAEKHTLLVRCKKALNLPSVEAVNEILQSNIKFADALIKLKVEVPTKISKRTGLVAPAFAKNDIGFQELAKHKNSRVRDLVAARLGAKSHIGEDRARRVYERGKLGPLPIMLNYCRARTFRWSGGDLINPQNFPTRKGRVGLRHALEAPVGEVFVIVDSAQIEARTLAWLAGQNDLVKVFAEGGDPYCDMASLIYDRPITKKDNPKERFVGKVGVLALGFKQSAKGFKTTLESGSMGPKVIIDNQTAFKSVKEYRNKNREIQYFWYDMGDFLRAISNPTAAPLEWVINNQVILRTEFEKIWMPNHLPLHYRSIESTGRGSYSYMDGHETDYIYDGKLTENVVQSLARIIVGEQMIAISKKYRIVSMAHDEVVYTVPRKEAKKALKFGLEQMRIAPSWCVDLPLDADGIYDKKYIKPD